MGAVMLPALVLAISAEDRRRGGFTKLTCSPAANMPAGTPTVSRRPPTSTTTVR